MEKNNIIKSYKVLGEWAHLNNEWKVKEGYSDENFNTLNEVIDELTNAVFAKMLDMRGGSDTVMEWKDADEWLDNLISEKCKANAEEREAIFEVLVNCIHKTPFDDLGDEYDGWIEWDDKVTIHLEKTNLGKFSDKFNEVFGVFEKVTGKKLNLEDVGVKREIRRIV